MYLYTVNFEIPLRIPVKHFVEDYSVTRVFLLYRELVPTLSGLYITFY